MEFLKMFKARWLLVWTCLLGLQLDAYAVTNLIRIYTKFSNDVEILAPYGIRMAGQKYTNLITDLQPELTNFTFSRITVEEIDLNGVLRDTWPTNISVEKGGNIGIPSDPHATIYGGKSGNSLQFYKIVGEAGIVTSNANNLIYISGAATQSIGQLFPAPASLNNGAFYARGPTPHTMQTIETTNTSVGYVYWDGTNWSAVTAVGVETTNALLLMGFPADYFLDRWNQTNQLVWENDIPIYTNFHGWQLGNNLSGTIVTRTNGPQTNTIFVLDAAADGTDGWVRVTYTNVFQEPNTFEEIVYLGASIQNNGGDARPTTAVDFQDNRTASDQVASGDYSTIGGGERNKASGDHSVISGGKDNSSTADNSSVGGGEDNAASGTGSRIGGGQANNASASYATVGGGFDNDATAQGSTVSGGEYNEARGSFSWAGGRYAIASNQASFVWGQGVSTEHWHDSGPSQMVIKASVGIFTNDPQHELHVHGELRAEEKIYTGIGIEFPDGTLLTSSVLSVTSSVSVLKVGDTMTGPLLNEAGFVGNGSGLTNLGVASGNVTNAVLKVGDTMTGPLSNNVSISSFLFLNLRNTASGTNSVAIGGTNNYSVGNNSVVVGGLTNRADAHVSVVVGGERNRADGVYSVVVGGQDNFANGADSGVVAGEQNTANDIYDFVGGGFRNEADGVGEGAFVGGGSDCRAIGENTVVAGGKQNEVLNNWGVIVGGEDNRVLQTYGFVGGGIANTVEGGRDAVVGGDNNKSSGAYCFVGGGSANQVAMQYSVIGGGNNNMATGSYSSVLGGEGNLAAGDYSVVPGGQQNKAHGANTFAAGWKARATNVGSFVWADAQDSVQYDSNSNQVSMRAQNGFRFLGGPITGDGSSLTGIVTQSEGDLNYINTSGDTMTGAFTVTTGNVHFNDDGGVSDFQVETDSETHALFVDGDTDNVGIGTDSPDVNLHVLTAGISGTPSLSGQVQFALQRSGTSNHNARVAIISGNNGSVSIDLGDTDDSDAGQIEFDNSVDDYFFRINLADKMSISSTNVWFSDSITIEPKAGATQVASGAASGEVWRTSGHATLPDNVLMIGQ